MTVNTLPRLHLQMLPDLMAVRAELMLIDEWNRRFPPLDILDEIGFECRRIRRRELFCKMARLALMS